MAGTALRRLELAAEHCSSGMIRSHVFPANLGASRLADRCGVRAELKPHQEEGVLWLIERFTKGVNVILGDEMGLGKTLQAITFLAYLHTQKGSPGPFLILCPLSVTQGWESEFARFAPKMVMMKYVGSGTQREEMRQRIVEHINGQAPSQRMDPALPFQVLLTTYELAMVDASFLSTFQWRYTVVDEAQRLKNPNSVLYKTLLDQYMIPHRLLLTGTPVQNNLTELWALLHFCMPSVFNDLDGFLAAFPTSLRLNNFSVTTQLSNAKPAADDPDAARKGMLASEEADSMVMLRKILEAFMLRRTKAELIRANVLSLPPLTIVTVLSAMVPLQRGLYASIVKKQLPKMLAAAAKGRTSSSSALPLQNIVIQLRKACSHPYLFDGVEPEPFEEGDHLVQASGKLLLLDGLLGKLKEGGHRVLIYAQMTRTLDVLQDYLEFRKYSYERLDGSVRAEERFAAVRSFTLQGGENQRSKSDGPPDAAFVFLLTTRAGGVGLNLTAADTVIFYEQDWNPQADKQAVQRAHRIGQTKPVLAINIVVRDSVEEAIMKRANKKLKLASDLMPCGEKGDGPHDANEVELSSTFDTKDLSAVIQHGLQKIFGPQVGKGAIDEKRQEGFTENKQCSDAEKERNYEEMVFEALKQRGRNDMEIGTAKKTTTEKDDEDEDVRNSELQDKEAFERLLMGKDIPGSGDGGNGDGGGDGQVELEKRSRTSLRKRGFEEDEKEREAEEEKKLKRQRVAADRKQTKWQAMGYQSTAVNVPAEWSSRGSLGEGRGEGEFTDKEENDEEDLHLLIGDCTHPSINRNEKAAIILSAVDDSGMWGRGGMFAALDRLSPRISEAYLAASEANDLHVGDLHLLALNAHFRPNMQQLRAGHPELNAAELEAEEVKRGQQSNVCLYVGLVVVQHYDRRRTIPRSDILLPAFETVLQKVAYTATRLQASVHVPRFRSRPDKGRAEWYGIERLLRKYLSSEQIPVNVYYYSRKSNQG